MIYFYHIYLIAMKYLLQDQQFHSYSVSFVRRLFDLHLNFPLFQFNYDISYYTYEYMYIYTLIVFVHYDCLEVRSNICYTVIIISRVMIRKLPQSVINQIAAGQVIQRPANVIKELVQNCIDAGATQINITINNGGMNLIKIVDNGRGINSQDYPLLCARFATSKIKSFEDLKEIGSFGFRGQALASLSYVSNLVVTSRAKQQKLGYQATFKDEKIIAGPKEISHNIGTKICATDLFFNITHRRSSLNPSEQKKRIIKILSHFCLHYSRIKFSLESEKGDECLPSNRSYKNCHSIGQTKMQIFQQITKLSFDKFSYIPQCNPSPDSTIQFKIQCILSKLNSTKGKTILININNRIVESPQITKAVDNAYSLCYQSVHQDVQNYFVYISLEIDPRKIDCNVHPTKKSIGLFGGNQFYETIMNFVLEKIKKQSAIKVVIKNGLGQNFKKKIDFMGSSQYSQVSQFSQFSQFSQIQSKEKQSDKQEKTSNFGSKSSTGNVYAFQKNRTDSKQLPLNYFFQKKSNDQQKHQNIADKENLPNNIIKAPKFLKVNFTETQFLQKNTEIRLFFQKTTYVGCYGFNYILIHYENKLYMLNIEPFTPIFIQNRIIDQPLLIKKIENPLNLQQILDKFVHKTKVLPDYISAYQWISKNLVKISEEYGIIFIKNNKNSDQEDEQLQSSQRILITHYPCLDQIFLRCSWGNIQTDIAYLLCRVYHSNSKNQYTQLKFQKFMEKFLQSQFVQNNISAEESNIINPQLQNQQNKKQSEELSPFNDKISLYFKDIVIPILKIKVGVLNKEKTDKKVHNNQKNIITNYLREMLDLKDVYKIFERC